MSQGKRLNLKGQKFGRWTVVEEVPDMRKGTYWKCLCECGNESVVSGSMLRYGKSQSCGCLTIENKIKAKTTHGQTKTRLYRIWRGMRGRCQYEKKDNYQNYGGRGIKVCDEWDNSFESFRDWALNNGYTDELTLDRIESDGDYKPSNCRWISLKEQQNNKRSNHLFTVNGATRTIKEWSEITGIGMHALYKRVKNGCTEEEFLRPSQRGKKS